MTHHVSWPGFFYDGTTGVFRGTWRCSCGEQGQVYLTDETKAKAIYHQAIDCDRLDSSSVNMAATLCSSYRTKALLRRVDDLEAKVAILFSPQMRAVLSRAVDMACGPNSDEVALLASILAAAFP